jgi:hypothetical protein
VNKKNAKKILNRCFVLQSTEYNVLEDKNTHKQKKIKKRREKSRQKKIAIAAEKKAGEKSVRNIQQRQLSFVA